MSIFLLQRDCFQCVSQPKVILLYYSLAEMTSKVGERFPGNKHYFAKKKWQNQPFMIIDQLPTTNSTLVLEYENQLLLGCGSFNNGCTK